MNISIVAVAYYCVDSLKRLLNYLEYANYYGDKVDLIISVDKSDTDVVENFSDSYKWEHGSKIVDKHSLNLGLRNHMLSLGKWFDKYDALVILEDDIIVCPNFFSYTKQTVNKYHTCSDIAGISLYGFSINYHKGVPFSPIKDEYDIYFMKCAMSWGEVWLKDSWKRFYSWYLENKDFQRVLPCQEACLVGGKSLGKYHHAFVLRTICILCIRMFLFLQILVRQEYIRIVPEVLFIRSRCSSVKRKNIYCLNIKTRASIMMVFLKMKLYISIWGCLKRNFVWIYTRKRATNHTKV